VKESADEFGIPENEEVILLGVKLSKTKCLTTGWEPVEHVKLE
jgi:hypothetical protein